MAFEPGELVDDVRRLGVRDGDLLYVHASLRRIGAVVGGAHGVITALESAVGSAGTLMMTLGAQDEWDWVNKHPEHSRAQLLAPAEPFDYRLTPADPDVGVLAEVLRTLPGTVVNNHPDGRFAARGQLAEELLREIPWNDYYGPGSPLERFAQLRGRILRLGANPDTVTLIHFAEYLAPIEGKRRITRHHKVTWPDGSSEVRAVSCLDDCDGIVDWPGKDYFAVILDEYLALGRARQGVVGNAHSELLEGSDILEFAVDWMTRNLKSRAT